MASQPPAERGLDLLGAVERRQLAAWLVWTGGLLAGFVTFCWAYLATWPGVSGDDIWVLSASHKWATQGIFGSDLYAGFFHAERHYYIALPVYQALQALTFRAFGTGIVQARAVTLASACVVLAALSWFAWRRGGLAVAIVAATLLAFWRVNLVSAPVGVPFLYVARTGRYDMTAVAWVWLTLLLLDRQLRHPAPLAAASVGVLAGLATLTQFFGVFVVPLAVVLLIWQRGWKALRERDTWLLLTTWVLTVAPYAVYVALHWSDFIGQAALKAGRTDFTNPRFYLANLGHEPRRYEILWARAPLGAGDAHPFGPWLLLLAMMPSLLYCVARARRGDVGCRIAVASVVVFETALALLESTKASLYTIVLWPSVCLLVALAAVGGIRWMWRRTARPWARPVVAVVAAGLALLVLVEGGRAYQTQWQAAQDASSYASVGARIAGVIGLDTTVVGSERWWWALRPRRYLAWNVIWQRWSHAPPARGNTPNLAEDVAWSGAVYVIVDEDVRGDLRLYPPELRARLDDFMLRCTTPVANWIDPTYGPISISKIVGCPLR